MLIEATKHPIRYTMRNGQEVRLIPGEPIDLPEPQAKALLAKASDRVRAVQPSDSDMVIEPVGTISPVYWESGGRILGPGKVSHVARVGARFWLCLELGGTWRWINSDLLRSKQAFEQQGRPA